MRVCVDNPPHPPEENNESKNIPLPFPTTYPIPWVGGEGVGGFDLNSNLKFSYPTPKPPHMQI